MKAHFRDRLPLLPALPHQTTHRFLSLFSVCVNTSGPIQKQKLTDWCFLRTDSVSRLWSPIGSNHLPRRRRRRRSDEETLQLSKGTSVSPAGVFSAHTWRQLLYYSWSICTLYCYPIPLLQNICLFMKHWGTRKHQVLNSAPPLITATCWSRNMNEWIWWINDAVTQTFYFWCFTWGLSQHQYWCEIYRKYEKISPFFIDWFDLISHSIC